MLSIRNTSVAMALAAISSIPVQAVEINTEFDVGGYIKLDSFWSRYSDGAISGNSVARQFYIPGAIPVGGDSENTSFDMHARQSRLQFTSKTILSNGEVLTGKITGDFLTTNDGNERITNSYTLRMRHVYLQYKNWLVGQTWSNFQNTSVIPETADFIGATDSIILTRQPQIRYTNGAWSFAVENPESTVTVNGKRVASDDNQLPDFTARYSTKGDWGNFSASALVRELSYNDGITDESTLGWGLSFASKFMLGQDDIRVMFSGGQGLGRYLGLNVANGAILEGTDLNTINSFGGLIAYRHLWNKKMRSTVSLSSTQIDNDAVLTPNATKSVSSMQVNLIYNPMKPLQIGVEWNHGIRKTEAAGSGTMDRLHFFAQYSF